MVKTPVWGRGRRLAGKERKMNKIADFQKKRIRKGKEKVKREMKKMGKKPLPAKSIDGTMSEHKVGF